jgi:hypothetical protein
VKPIRGLMFDETKEIKQIVSELKPILSKYFNDEKRKQVENTSDLDSVLYYIIVTYLGRR